MSTWFERGQSRAPEATHRAGAGAGAARPSGTLRRGGGEGGPRGSQHGTLSSSPGLLGWTTLSLPILGSWPPRTCLPLSDEGSLGPPSSLGVGWEGPFHHCQSSDDVFLGVWGHCHTVWTTAQAWRRGWEAMGGGAERPPPRDGIMGGKRCSNFLMKRASLFRAVRSSFFYQISSVLFPWSPTPRVQLALEQWVPPAVPINVLGGRGWGSSWVCPLASARHRVSVASACTTFSLPPLPSLPCCVPAAAREPGHGVPRSQQDTNHLCCPYSGGAFCCPLPHPPPKARRPELDRHTSHQQPRVRACRGVPGGPESIT